MEKEIEKLKQTYLKTEVPVELEFYGFEDVMDKIKNPVSSFPLYRLVGMIVIILIVLSGFAGVTLASKPNSTLYPLKVAAQNAIADVTHTSPKHVEDAIDNFISPKRVTPTLAPVIIKPVQTPTSTPTPSISEKKRIKVEMDDEERPEINNQQKQEDNHDQEVKGVNTTKEPEKKENTLNSSSQQQNENRSGEHKQDQSSNTSSNSHNNSSEHEKE